MLEADSSARGWEPFVKAPLVATEGAELLVVLVIPALVRLAEDSIGMAEGAIPIMKDGGRG